MDLQELAEQERVSESYAHNFFAEEKEMQGIFDADMKILGSAIKKKGRLLDVAMGPGRHVRHFARKGFEVWGNDFNRHMIGAARKFVGSKKVHYTNHDMRNLKSIKGNYFDYVICMGASLGSVYRSRERQKAVDEMARAAKKGGLVLIHAHNFWELTEPADFPNILNSVKDWLLNRKFEFGDVVYSHGTSFREAYMHWFTPGELRALMEKAGLKVERKFFLKGPDQSEIVNGSGFLANFRAGGFVFVGRKV